MSVGSKPCGTSIPGQDVPIRGHHAPGALGAAARVVWATRARVVEPSCRSSRPDRREERSMSESTTGASVLAGLDGVMDSLEDLYRDVHSHPELSMQEHRTAGKAAERLQAAGYDVTTGVGGTGGVGLLSNGDGPTVMLRADMDALPVEEATGLPYASTATATDPDGNEVPVMHACGH